jgi:GntR family transcriptional repressor for pyruvate dehydrogenase complex
MEPSTTVITSVKLSASASLAEHLQNLILAGRLRFGESLPPERELMEEFGVSRATVREALRVLGAHGLIAVRRGRNGGSYVCGPSGGAVSKSLDLLIQGQAIRFIDLLAAREAIEPVAAAQAAVYRTDADIKALYELTQACEQSFRDFESFTKTNVEWHLAVVKASHNHLFDAFMTSISSALFAATHRKEFDLQTRETVSKAHWQIFDAIRKGDQEAARRKMGKHISAYGDRLSKIDFSSPATASEERTNKRQSQRSPKRRQKTSISKSLS